MKPFATASMLFAMTLFLAGCGGEDNYTTEEGSSDTGNSVAQNDQGGGPPSGMDPGAGMPSDDMNDDADAAADGTPPGYGEPPSGYGAAPEGEDLPSDYGAPPEGEDLPSDYGAAPEGEGLPPGYGAAPEGEDLPPGYGAPPEGEDLPSDYGTPPEGDPAATGVPEEGYPGGPGGEYGGQSKKLPVIEGDPAPAQTAAEGLNADIAKLDFAKTPLPEAAKYLTHMTGVPIEVDEGVPAEKAVGASAQNVTLEDALYIITEPYGLAYRVKKDGSSVSIATRTRRDKTSGGSKAIATLRKKISGEFNDVPLKDIMAAVSESSGIHFVLLTNVNGGKPVTIVARNTPIKDFMRKLNQMGLIYRVSKSGRVILIANARRR